MNEERSITVSVDIRLSFEVEEVPFTEKDNFDVAAESAVVGLRAHLARHAGSKLLSITRHDQ
jgi:ribosomal protein L31E